MKSTHLLDQEQEQQNGKPTLHCDLAIIGGGGAGMSILWSLAQKEYFKNHKVVLLEPEAKEADDRTWCFWAKPDDKWVQRLNPCISHKWTKAKNKERIDKLAPYAYYQVRSADFYAEVKRTFAHEKNVQWIREKAAQNTSSDSKEIELSESTIKADHIFDSRVDATLIAKNPIELWQSFLGWRIRTKDPVLDPSTLELMNFDVPQKGETQFLYVLPTEKDEILIELTRFGREKIDADWAAQYLEEWVKKAWSEFEIIESESGAIPMSQSLDVSQKSLPHDTHRIPVGTAAGAVKPTTGYAFYQMLEHGEQLAEALIQNKPFPTIYRKRRYRFYDRLLLSILKEEPQWGKPIFKQLFQNVKTPRVLTFLGEKMTLRQEIPLLFSLPILPFLRALDREYTKGFIKGLFSLFQTRQILVWASILLVLIHQFLPAATHLIALPLLGAGLIFPGIPHGALDHVLEGKPPTKAALAPVHRNLRRHHARHRRSVVAIPGAGSGPFSALFSLALRRNRSQTLGHQKQLDLLDIRPVLTRFHPGHASRRIDRIPPGPRRFSFRGTTHLDIPSPLRTRPCTTPPKHTPGSHTLLHQDHRHPHTRHSPPAPSRLCPLLCRPPQLARMATSTHRPADVRPPTPSARRPLFHRRIPLFSPLRPRHLLRHPSLRRPPLSHIPVFGSH